MKTDQKEITKGKEKKNSVTRARFRFPEGELENMLEHTTLKPRSCQLHHFFFQSNTNYSGLVVISPNTEGIILR